MRCRDRAAAKDVRELLARFADDRRVDDRHHLVDVVMEETEEQCLVPVLQAGEVDVALERCRLATIVLHTRASCWSMVLTAGGTSPSRPRSARSPSVNAVPLFVSGSRSSASPRVSTAMYSSPVTPSCSVNHSIAHRRGAFCGSCVAMSRLWLAFAQRAHHPLRAFAGAVDVLLLGSEPAA